MKLLATASLAASLAFVLPAAAQTAGTAAGVQTNGTAGTSSNGAAVNGETTGQMMAHDNGAMASDTAMSGHMKKSKKKMKSSMSGDAMTTPNAGAQSGAGMSSGGQTPPSH